MHVAIILRNSFTFFQENLLTHQMLVKTISIFLFIFIFLFLLFLPLTLFFFLITELYPVLRAHRGDTLLHGRRITLTNYEKINLPGNARHIKNWMQKGMQLGMHYELNRAYSKTEVVHAFVIHTTRAFWGESRWISWPSSEYCKTAKILRILRYIRCMMWSQSPCDLHQRLVHCLVKRFSSKI